jgi:hypothetical protein
VSPSYSPAPSPDPPPIEASQLHGLTRRTGRGRRQSVRPSLLSSKAPRGGR